MMDLFVGAVAYLLWGYEIAHGTTHSTSFMDPGSWQAIPRCQDLNCKRTGSQNQGLDFSHWFCSFSYARLSDWGFPRLRRRAETKARKRRPRRRQSTVESGAPEPVRQCDCACRALGFTRWEELWSGVKQSQQSSPTVHDTSPK